MPQEYRIKSESVDVFGREGRVFHVAGTARVDATEELELATQAALNEGVGYFVFDFAETDYIGSGILRILLSLRKAARQTGGSVQVAALKASIREHVFDALGFSKLLKAYASVEEALQDISESDD